MTFYTWLTSSPHPESTAASAAVGIPTVSARGPSAHKHAAIIRVHSHGMSFSSTREVTSAALL